jgi:hypothetical protein
MTNGVDAMISKTVPLSVRVSDEDAAFLAQLDIADAKTPSEKLRAILASERRRHEGTQDPDTAIDLVQDMLRPAARRVRREEVEGRRSDLVHMAYEEVPELAGLLMAGPQSGKGLPEFEARLATQIANLAKHFIELGLFSRDRCYVDGVVNKHLPAVTEVVDLLKLKIAEDRKRTPHDR